MQIFKSINSLIFVLLLILSCKQVKAQYFKVSNHILVLKHLQFAMLKISHSTKPLRIVGKN